MSTGSTGIFLCKCRGNICTESMLSVDMLKLIRKFNSLNAVTRCSTTRCPENALSFLQTFPPDNTVRDKSYEEQLRDLGLGWRKGGSVETLSLSKYVKGGFSRVEIGLCSQVT